MFNKDLKDFLDEKSSAYENPNFLEKDPIKIPHLFKKRRYRNFWIFSCFYFLGKSFNYNKKWYSNDGIDGK